MDVCSSCGTENVYRLMWQNINTNEVVETYKHDGFYCGDCDADCGIVSSTRYRELRREAWEAAQEDSGNDDR